MLGELVAVAGDAAIVAFTMGGMGPNHSDVPSMVLLPELLYRHAFGQPLLDIPPQWTAAPESLPILDGERELVPGESGLGAGSRRSRHRNPTPPFPAGFARWGGACPRRSRASLKGVRSGGNGRGNGTPTARQGLQWQPATRYRLHWPRMPAFALPSFYDGRIRINLRGRERHGMVEPSRYEDTFRGLETMLRECRNPRTGEPVVDSFERASTPDPLALTPSEADLLVIWRGVISALEHPRLGLIGPVPLRRTGGHTGPHGMACLAGPGIEPGDRGLRSSFDVAPTVAKLLDVEPPARMSGTSLL